MAGKIKVQIVEDEYKIAEIIKTYLLREGYNIKISNTGKKAIKDFNIYNPDLIILDRMLPEKSGEEVLNWIKRIRDVPVIMVTAKSEEKDVIEGFDLGAEDYIKKPFSPRILVRRVKSVLKRVDAENLKKSINLGGLFIDPEKMVIKNDKKEINLSPVEFDILYLLAKKKGRILSREQIFNNVFDDKENKSYRTIDTHIKNIRKKIKNHNSLIKTVYGKGYRIEIE